MPRNLAAAAVDDDDHQVVPLKRPLETLTLAEFLKRDFPPREMMLAPWLPAKGLALLFAPRGIGKTHFALGVAYAVATGGSFLKWLSPKPRRVLLLDGEMPAATLQERLADIMQHSLIDPPDEGYVRLLASDLCEFGMPDLATREGQDEIAPLIGDAELIVVDNLSTICRSGKENESESWAIVQAWALEQRRAGRSVLFIHHAGKGGEQRGTSKREDVMDSVVKLSRPEDYEASEGARFIVAFTKSRGFTGAEADPFEAMLRDGLWSTKDLQDAQGEQAYQLSQDGLTQRQIADELKLSLSKVNRLIARHKENLACRSGT
jgi:putative DNA primase/helicase